MRLVCVDPAQVHTVWPRIKDGVRLALKRGVGGLFESTERDVLDGTTLVWLAQDRDDIRGVLLTDLVKSDDGLQCVIATLHGVNMKDWFKFLPVIEQFAKAEGCKSIRLTGRSGWARVLRGYDQIGVVLRKEIG